MKNIAIAIDISGGITPDLFAKFKKNAEYQVLLEKPDTNIHLIYFNHEVVFSEKVTVATFSVDVNKFPAYGGTFIEPLQQYAKENDISELTVYSDGFFHFPEVHEVDTDYQNFATYSAKKYKGS